MGSEHAVSAGMVAAVLMVVASGPAGAGPADVREARVTLDARDAEIRPLAEALASVAGLQTVFDPGVSCRFTVSVREARWSKVLGASLNACGLGYEAEGSVLRIAPRETLQREATDRRRLAEAQAQARQDRVAIFRLSYARAREMAPLIERTLGAQAKVTYDERSNTLLIVY